MALAITDLGNATSNSSSATLVTGATITASVGDWLVALVAADNAGASGVASLIDVQDSQGNAWTQRALINYDPGAAAAGATLGIFTCQVSNALSGGTVTANFSPNTTAKAIEVYRVQPGSGEIVQFVAADATGTTGTSAAPAAATVSVDNGNTIFGAAAIENSVSAGGTVTGDSDTTNGNWSALVNRVADSGSSSTSMDCASQFKTVNATGNQTWDLTLSGGSKDWAASYLVLGPVALPIGAFDENILPPRSRSINLLTHIDSFKPQLAGQDNVPVRRFEWPTPQPPARSIDLRTHVSSFKPEFIGIDNVPIRPQEWPIPPAIKPRWYGLINWSYSLNIVSPPSPPVRAFEWPVPQPPARSIDLRTHVDSLKLQLLGKDVFFGAPGQAPIYVLPLPPPKHRPVDLLSWFSSANPVSLTHPPTRDFVGDVPPPKIFPVALRTWISTFRPIPAQVKPPANANFDMPQRARVMPSLYTWSTTAIVPTERITAFILG